MQPAIYNSKILPGWFLLSLFILAGCLGRLPAMGSKTSSPSPTLIPTQAVSLQPASAAVPTAEATDTAVPSPSPTLTPTGAATSTATAPPTDTPAPTGTPTLTLTPTITLTPTYDFPDATVLMQANCRYGPGQAYLYSHGLYSGDQAEVHGRNYSGSWLWIKPENLDRHCWASASVLEVQGDVLALVVFQSRLPQSTLYGPPDNVQATRDGDRVIVTWDPVWMTEDDDRGYLIEANICQDGFRVPVAVHTDEPSYEFTDGTNCSGESSGLLYTVEKHGYTQPVTIPWP